MTEEQLRKEIRFQILEKFERDVRKPLAEKLEREKNSFSLFTESDLREFARKKILKASLRGLCED